MFALIIGAGFAGVGMGVALRRAGIDDFLIVEKGGGVGGVWRDNTYPGAACDVPSHLYSFSFEPWPDWSRRYAPQEEIHAYLKHCAEKYRLESHLRSGVAVVSAIYDEAQSEWQVHLSDGQTLRTKFLIGACGQLSEPATPDIPGLSTFSGPCFHSARWDHGVDLEGKRVGVIGTGASAIQFVPEVARRAAKLILFQRSAPYVLPKMDWRYGKWRRRLWSRFPSLQKCVRWMQYTSHELRGLVLRHMRPLVKLYEWRYAWILRRAIGDASLRSQLRPDHPLGCKRILFSNDYLRAINKPTVTVVNNPIRSVDDKVVATQDAAHDLDVLILGTGFKATEFLSTIRIEGRNGRLLSDCWADGARAFLGMAVPGFPNLFILYGPNTNLGHNSIIFMLERQIDYVMQAVRAASAPGAGALEVRADADRAYDTELTDALGSSIWATGCDNWYRNAEGRVVNNWPWSTLHYARRLRQIRLEDYHLHDD